MIAIRSRTIFISGASISLGIARILENHYIWGPILTVTGIVGLFVVVWSDRRLAKAGQ